MKRFRVLFLSIQPSLLAAVISILNADPFISADTDTYESLNKRNKKYDVVVYDDNSLSKNDELLLLNTIHNNNKPPGILYTSIADKNYLNQFIYAGIDGIVSQRADLPVIKEAIGKVLNGEKYRCREVEKILCEDAKGTITLSKFENKILDCVIDGLSSKEIAEKLFISQRTVEKHRQMINKKLWKSNSK